MFQWDIYNKISCSKNIEKIDMKISFYSRSNSNSLMPSVVISSIVKLKYCSIDFIILHSFFEPMKLNA